MVFTSYRFIFLFLPIVFIGFLLLSRYKKPKWISLWLALASVAFYAYWNPKDLEPLIFSVFINYTIYRWMKIAARDPIQKSILTLNNIKITQRFLILSVGIIFNILFLSYYKYLHFFLGGFLSLNPASVALPVAIPLGISFYTFTQIAFLVDCYHKQYEKNDFLNYFLFVSYFPHLVCGPILSFKELYPQLQNTQKFRFSISNLNLFIFCFSIGLFKKAVIADYIGIYVPGVFDAAAGTIFDFKTAFLATVSYSLQLYFDFSGYSDMAVGLSYLFGLKIPDNFNAPYQATSIIDFWRRWHISLSQFLKNYVYIPLGGNRGLPTHHYRNLGLTMILGGFWHGASWTFIMWGVYHGALLSINHLYRSRFKKEKPVVISIHHKTSVLYKSKRMFTILFTFIFVALGWVLFRCANFSHALNIYKSLFGFSANISNKVSLSFEHSTQWQILLLGLAIVFFLPDTLVLREKFFTAIESGRQKGVVRTAIACALLAVISILCFSRVQYFLYSGF